MTQTTVIYSYTFTMYKNINLKSVLPDRIKKSIFLENKFICQRREFEYGLYF